MSPELEALARRAVACKGWRWMPGMRAVEPGAALQHTYRLRGERRAKWPEEYDWPHSIGLCLPDLTDPATLGCLLSLVRKAHGQPHATVHWCWEFDANHPTHVAERGLPRRMWAVDDIHDWREASATSEAAALVAALEAAP